MMTKEQHKPRGNRYKIVYVPQEYIMDFLTYAERDCIIRPIVEGLPKRGCEVIAVQYSLSRNAFAFKVYHSSFDIIPIGQKCPEIIIKELILFEKVQNYDRVTA